MLKQSLSMPCRTDLKCMSTDVYNACASEQSQGTESVVPTASSVNLNSDGYTSGSTSDETVSVDTAESRDSELYAPTLPARLLLSLSELFIC